MCSILTVLPSQLQHSCLNSTPALPLFPCRGVFGGGEALCFYKLVVPLGFPGTVPPLALRSNEQCVLQIISIVVSHLSR